jgi:tetratricopeptide (TPR) repeat protein
VRLAWLVAVGIVWVGAPRAARAQDEPDSATEEARALFEAGRTAYDAGRFESALDSFGRAYELSRRPALLFNMGSALERLRRDDEALEHYERYLREVPGAENAQFVRARIHFLRSPRRTAGAPEASRPSGNVAEEWWFWTLIAVVVIGAGVGIGVGVALSDPGMQEPLPGNFVDGVAMALVRF